MARVDGQLSQNEEFRTQDFEAFRTRLTSEFCALQARRAGPTNGAEYLFRVSARTEMKLVELGYGGEVSVTTAPGADAYQIGFLLAGRNRSICAGERIGGSTEIGIVRSPGVPIEVHHAVGNRALVVQIDGAAVQRRVEALTGRTVTRPIEFVPRLDMRRSPGADLRRYICFLAANLDRDPVLSRSGKFMTGIQDLILNILLAQQPHNFSLWLEREPRDTSPDRVRVVEEFIEVRAHQALTTEDFVMVANTSARSLFRAFRKHRGYSPHAFLKSVRLARAQAALREPEEGVSVTRIALETGFGHLGRFSAAYKDSFGESPSETLRAALGDIGANVTPLIEAKPRYVADGIDIPCMAT